jgi:GNAT superfamily N-acetyltransferase
MRRNPTTPLPEALSPTEPALMTVGEFIAFRNPGEKYHPEGAYKATVASLNDGLSTLGTARARWKEYRVEGVAPRYGEAPTVTDRLVFRDDGNKVVAVLVDGVLYRDRFHTLPDYYTTHRDRVPLVIRSEREVKEPSAFVRRVYDPAKANRKRFPHVVQRVALGADLFEVRAEKPPQDSAQDTLVVLNPEGEIVARADDEWGATLLRVAEEYRGRGLGKLLAEMWYAFNPASTSGGFTSAGAANARATWVARVREFQARGWYSDLVRRGDLTLARVREILSGLPAEKPATSRLPSNTPKASPDLRIYVDEDGASFVVYDARFLDDPKEEYLHGYGLFRDAPSVGTFLYRIEYEPEYRKLATAVALQLARDNGERIYVKSRPGDMVDPSGLPHVKRAKGYLSLTQDILPLADARRVEQVLRKRKDPYDEALYRLLEMAESKWA